MSELRSVVESLRAELLADLPDARIEEDFIELHQVMEQLEVERLRRLGEIDGRRVFSRDGYLSCASWLVSRLKVAWGAARDQVRMARGLNQMPATREALESGEVSISGARLLVLARKGEPEAFEEAEELLVEAARVHSVSDLNRAISFWAQRVENERWDRGEDTRRARRRLHASVTYQGMVRVDGDLDPETGETLLTALGAVLDAEAHAPTVEDRRTSAQRRADALGEICRQWLDRSDRPTVGGERPHIAVTVGLDALRDARGTAEFDHSGAVSSSVAQRLACDASITRIVLSPDSEPLDVGRRTPVVPAGMRRALVIRDRHCQFPGCDRPATWCDAHHVVPWAKGGPTALWNLTLLCRRHHRLIHDHGGFRLELVQGRPMFRRPDGSVMEERGPP